MDTEFSHITSVSFWAMTRRSAARTRNDASGSTQPDRSILYSGDGGAQKLPVAIQAWGYLKILGQVTLGEQQAVSPQPLEPPCGILVEGGKRRAAQAGPLKRDDSIGEVTALV